MDGWTDGWMEGLMARYVIKQIQQTVVYIDEYRIWVENIWAITVQNFQLLTGLKKFYNEMLENQLVFK